MMSPIIIPGLQPPDPENNTAVDWRTELMEWLIAALIVTVLLWAIVTIFLWAFPDEGKPTLVEVLRRQGAFLRELAGRVW